ncbi:MAG TPA: hypothetical protein VJ397_06935 [Thermoplasmata archaeon]|nr:hypothetical protein [Thermoplasmata archaeon]
MRSALLVAGLLLMVLVGSPPAARAVGPTVTESWWEQRYPQSPEQISLMARVVPDGGNPIVDVSATYCTVPVGVCTFHRMNYSGADDVWRVVVDMYEGAVGAKFLAYAVDSNAMTQGTNETIVYASTLSLDASMDAQVVLQDATLTVSGTGTYNDNASVPLETSDVAVSVDGTPAWSGLTDAEGRFSHAFTAPALGDHIVRVTASNRTLSQSVDLPLSVVAEPVARVQVKSVELLTALAEEGDTLTFRVVVENVGNLAGNGTVTLRVGNETILNTTAALAPSEEKLFTANWVATAGSHEVSAAVDGAGNGGGNTQTIPITIKPVTSTDPVDTGPPLLLIAAAVVLLALAGIAGALLIRKRPRKA